MNRRSVLSFLAGIGAFAVAGAVLAQSTYPTKPVRVIVPYPAGGVVDLFARAVTETIAKHWSQPIIVEARPGASSNLGTQAVMRSEPDGYTWLMAGPGLTANPSLFKNAGWNPVRDFAGAGVAGYSPLLLVVTDKLPAKTLRDVVELARAQPGTISAGTMNGSSGQFILEALKYSAKVEFLTVPYKGAPSIVADLVNGTVQVTTLPLTVALAHVQSGRLRAVAIAAESRSPLLPEVPTFAEAGYPEGTVVPWYGFVVPRATPPAIVRRINEEINEALKSPEVRERILKMGGEVARPMTPADVDLLIKSDTEKYSALIRRGNITAE